MEVNNHETVLKAWRYVGYIAFTGMINGLLCITAFIPLTFMVMTEVDLSHVATHCKSMAKITYWCAGIGGVMALIYFITGLAVLIRKKKFLMACVILVFIHLLSMFGIMLAGIIPSESHKEFMSQNWKNFEATTVNLIQNHFSCCGFESSNENVINGVSCFAIPKENIAWPDGCYLRVMSISLPIPSVQNSANEAVTAGKASWNIFICAFSVFFICIFAVDLLTIFGTVYLFKITDFNTINNCSKLPTKNQQSQERLKENITTITVVSLDSRSSNDGETSHDDKSEIKQSESNVSTQSYSSSNDSKSSTDTPWYSKLSHVISHSLESGFYWLGFLIGKHPTKTILMSSIFTGSLCLGLLQRRDAQTGHGIYLSPDSRVVQNFNVYSTRLTVIEQVHRLIIEDESNVLNEGVLKKTWDIDKSVKAIESSTQMTFDTLCLRYNAGCGQESLFELWNYNDQDISMLTDDDILQKIQPKDSIESPMFGGSYLIDNVIGGQSYDVSGNISSAKAHMLVYKTKYRPLQFIGDWEDKFTEIANDSKSQGLNVFVRSATGYRTERENSYQSELPLLVAGFALVFFYIAIMTGKFSRVRHRVFIAMLGVVTAGMAMGGGIGLAASLQFEWTIVHLIAPFLILGIGVDDMFIILQMWNMVDEDPRLKSMPLHEKAGYVLKTAGVSITVTSITDLVAFAVMSISSLQVFGSFSAYTSLSILLLFILQCTFFMACTVLDQKRRDQRRDACICCYVYDKTHKDGKCANKEIFQWIFENDIGYFLEFKAIRAVVIIVTLILTGVMAWGFYKLEVTYDPDWYLPSDSYILDFNAKEDEYFQKGMDVTAYVFSEDMYSERNKLDELYLSLINNAGVDNDFVKSWYNTYKGWTSMTNLTEQQWIADVTNFLNSKDGNIYFYDVVYNRNGTKLTACKFPFRHKVVPKTNEDVKIMESIYDGISKIGFNYSAFPYTEDYVVLEVSKIIGDEVYRNIGITLGVVFLVVLPTIASLQMSLWVGLCVVFTIVDVAGTMHFAGLYIEAGTVITLLLTVGLAVDYAAHVAHKYLTLKGSRVLRMRVALSHVGPAVFNGGFSTFLALSLLAGSSTYSYKVVFTVFSCVVGFGLWNGLIFLSSVLGFIGPPPHKSAHEAMLSERAKLRRVGNQIENPTEETIKRS